MGDSKSVYELLRKPPVINNTLDSPFCQSPYTYYQASRMTKRVCTHLSEASAGRKLCLQSLPTHFVKAGLGGGLFGFLFRLPFSAGYLLIPYENADGEALVVVGTDF